GSHGDPAVGAEGQCRDRLWVAEGWTERRPRVRVPQPSLGLFVARLWPPRLVVVLPSRQDDLAVGAEGHVAAGVLHSGAARPAGRHVPLLHDPRLAVAAPDGLAIRAEVDFLEGAHVNQEIGAERLAGARVPEPDAGTPFSLGVGAVLRDKDRLAVGAPGDLL